MTLRILAQAMPNKEKTMQITIELPDNLGEELMQKENIEFFVQEAIKKMLQTEKTLTAEHLPITQSLVGLLKGFDIDERDYQRHLEEKYL